MLLADVALLSQSRGSLYATPVMLVLVFALLPGRMRTLALLVPVAAGGARRALPPSCGPANISCGGASSTGFGPRRRRRRCRWRPPCGRRRGGARGGVREPRELAERALRRAPAPEQHRCGALPSSAVSPAAWWRPATPSRASKSALGQLQGRLRRGPRDGAAADQRPGKQPLRLLPGGAGRIRCPSDPGDRRRQLPAAVPRPRAHLTRPRTTRTASSCARSPRRAWSGALLALVGLGAALIAGAGRAGSRPARAGGGRGRARGLRLLGRTRLIRLVLGVRRPWGARLCVARSRLCAVPRARPGIAPAAPPRAPPRRRPRRGRGGSLDRAFAGAPGGRGLAGGAVAEPAEVESAARVWMRTPGVAYARLEEAARLNPLSDEADLAGGQHRAALRGPCPGRP